VDVPVTHAYCRRWLPATFLCGLSVAASAETILYHLESATTLYRYSSSQLLLLRKLNHADAAHLPRLPRILVPNRWDEDELVYSPMPADVPRLSTERKAVVVDLPGQVFGAYEDGTLVRWGPVSSGGPRHPTPSGAYHLNFHARLKISTVDPTWKMPWYFNFSSTKGLGLHEYTLPGRPASHGCVRMLSTDAQWLFHWGEPGALVLVLGRYNFGAPPPWLRPTWWSEGVTVLGRAVEAN
jgi:hypothetical protein